MCWGHEALTEQAGVALAVPQPCSHQGAPGAGPAEMTWGFQGCQDKGLTPVERGLVLAGGGPCGPQPVLGGALQPELRAYQGHFQAL